jgi:phenylalanyl-tRNA synthetase beta chain
MKISFNWLRELCTLSPGVTAAAVGERLTLAGLEVESIERRGRDVRGVQVAEVRGVRPHPGAEKLSIVRVRVRAAAGAVEEDVVCGAPNVPAPGGLVAWAPPGASLPGGRTLDRREIRGVASPGMLCSEAELGISDAADGILILPPSSFQLGADVAGAIGLLDEVLEVNVTPNRPDALSHAGIAREIAALLRTRWRLPRPDHIVPAPLPPGRGVGVEIRDPTACPRYSARVVTGLHVAPSPIEMRVRLAACGVRAISNLVDVTNYVMLETGHPLHAFDLEKVNGGIVVRRANRAERMTTLDGAERPLQESDVVIADGRGGALALAGVMGGAASEVSVHTTAVLLEAATFDPRSVRRTARRLGLHSEASHRFERGVDANGIPHAGLRAAALLARLGGGEVNGEVVDRYPVQQYPRKVVLSLAGLGRTAGYDIPLAVAAEKLASIEIAAEVASDALTATVPTFRPDISIEPDLIEEVMRLCGYDRVPARLPPGTRAPATSPEALADRARDGLAAQGLHEAVTWGFVPRHWLKALGKGRPGRQLDEGVIVKNPISADYEVMRTSLFPGLAEAARRNLARGVPDVALFEVGPVVIRGADPVKDHPIEPMYAAGILVGRRADWLKAGSMFDFYDAKRIVDELLRALGIEDASYRPFALALAPAAAASDPTILHPGIAARIFSGPQGGGREIGMVGEVHPTTRQRFGLDESALYFEVEVDAVAGERRTPISLAPPRFPAATRDVSFWIALGVTADDQRAAIAQVGEPLLREIAVLEDFRDPRHTPAGKKGMLWTMTYRAADRTLTDAEVDSAHARLVEALRGAHAIEIR